MLAAKGAYATYWHRDTYLATAALIETFHATSTQLIIGHALSHSVR
jgi:hypothetical protein